jgi:uncharacterized Zn finger protein
MDDPPSITEAAVRRLARTQSFERGENYYERGAVVDLERRGDTLRGRVEGSQYEPYRVDITLDETGIADTACSCPYDHGGICKHRVAVVLTYIRDPETIEERPAVTELLTDLDREALSDLLTDLLADRPELVADVERRLKRRRAPADPDDSGGSGDSTDRHTQPDPETIRSHVRSLLEHPNPRRSNVSDPRADMKRRVDGLHDLLDEARAFVEAGEGEAALSFLEAMTEEVMGQEWLALSHDDVAIFDFLEELGMVFTEAVLTADLSASARAEWADQLDDWADGLASYGAGSTFAAAERAAERGWDSETLQAVLTGETDDFGTWDGDRPRYADGLVAARLAVLEREGRTEAYCNLARAAGETERYVTKLVEVGRDEEAVEHALAHVSTAGEALAVAKTLRDHDHQQATVRVARRGLETDSFRTLELGKWLRDAASASGDDDAAIEGAVAAFEADPSLERYRTVEEVAGEDWPALREDLLDGLRRRQPGRSSAVDHADVFLAEGMVEEAIAIADRSGHESVVRQVAQAIRDERPQWTIEACKEQAEPIIEAGQSDRYREAVRWLETAGEAAETTGELDAWRGYVEGLREEHYRKYKLRPMLDNLLAEF